MKTFLIIAWLASHVVDGASTARALAHGRVEGNPLLPQNGATIFVLDTVVGVGGALALNHYWQQHPRWAAAVAVFGASLHTGAAVRNYRASW